MSDPVQQPSSSPVAGSSAFVRLLETKARVKMLDVLMRHSYVSLSQGQIAERAGVNQSTVSRNIGVFENLGVVEASGSHPTEYRINTESPVVQGLEQAQTNLLEHTERLHGDDVRQLEDCQEWQPVDQLPFDGTRTQPAEDRAFESEYAATTSTREELAPATRA